MVADRGSSRSTKRASTSPITPNTPEPMAASPAKRTRLEDDVTLPPFSSISCWEEDDATSLGPLPLACSLFTKLPTRSVPEIWELSASVRATMLKLHVRAEESDSRFRTLAKFTIETLLKPLFRQFLRRHLVGSWMNKEGPGSLIGDTQPSAEHTVYVCCRTELFRLRSPPQLLLLISSVLFIAANPARLLLRSLNAVEFFLPPIGSYRKLQFAIA